MSLSESQFPDDPRHMDWSEYCPSDGDEAYRSLMGRLVKLSTCTVADALVKLDGGMGCFTDFHMYSPAHVHDPEQKTRIAGPLLTVKMVSAKDTTSPRPPRHFVDDCPAGSILLIQSPPGTKSACWGGLLTAAAVKKGITGVIIDGACRDLNEHGNFPVFARSHSVLGQASSTRVSELRCSLVIRPVAPSSDSDPPFPPHVVVGSGDIALADVDGVVTIDGEMLADVVQLAEQLQKRDEETRKLIESGKDVEESFKATRPGYRVDA